MQNIQFSEGVLQGRPALALVATKPRLLAKGNGVGGQHNKIKVPTGYIRAVRLIAQADGGGLRAARRDLMAIVGSNQKNWRIATGVA